MSSLQKLTVALIVASLVGFGAAGELPPLEEESAAAEQLRVAALEARLIAGLTGGGGGGLVDCWNALLELRSCTNEIVLFFINGESYLGLDCCRAIRVITRHCWTSMLTTLGFTTQESDILRGYCDFEATAPPPAPELPPPPTTAPTASKADTELAFDDPTV
ncbi:egg cell-secreted protein 1.4-like [Musa acuminata AAA Group]|uniref:egg cell-secreted protein 1.4-like n=1 Tax=Musa acuminata AAA Group TaxID=214697 RepID=UPI0031DDB5DD